MATGNDKIGTAKEPSRRVLIIDDDGKNIFALSAILREKGFETVSVNEAEQGLKLLVTDPSIAIVLTDIMMPGTDGYDLIRRIRQHPQLKQTPLIAVTAKAMAGDREKCMEAGADDYVSKPIDIDRLLALLRKYKIQ